MTEKIFYVVGLSGAYNTGLVYKSDKLFHNIHHKEAHVVPSGRLTVFHREWYEGFNLYKNIDDSLFYCLNRNYCVWKVSVPQDGKIKEIRKGVYVSDSINVIDDGVAVHTILCDAVYCMKIMTSSRHDRLNCDAIVACVAEELYSNKEFAIFCIKRSINSLKYYFDNFMNDEAIFIAAVNSAPRCFDDFPENLKCSESTLMKVSSDKLAQTTFFKYLCNADSLSLALKTLPFNGSLYDKFSDAIRSNKDTIYAAIGSLWCIYEKIPEEMKNNVDVCLYALSKEPGLYSIIPMSMREQAVIAESVFKKHGSYVVYCPKWLNSKKMAELVIQSHVHSYYYFSESVQKDPKIKEIFEREILLYKRG